MAHVPTSTDDWPHNCLGRLVLRDFHSAKANAEYTIFGPTGSYTFADRGDYKIVVKKRREGRTCGKTDGYVYLSGNSKRVAGMSQLRSDVEIRRHFNAHPELNVIMFRAHTD